MSFSPFAQGRAVPKGGSSVTAGWAVVGLALLMSTGCSEQVDGDLGSSAGGQAGMDTPDMMLPDAEAAGSGSQADPPPVNPPDPADWFAAVQSADCSVPPALVRTRIRRLSNTQWVNTVHAALSATVDPSKLPPDSISSSTWFNTDATKNKVNVLLANAYFDLGTTIAGAAATAALTAYPCLSTKAANPTCSAPFLADYGQRLFRRPLTPDETSRYSALLTEQAALDPADVAVGTVIRALLMSPNMIFITELGSSAAGEVALTSYEQAELISYLIADNPPDQLLMQAAAKGELGTTADRATHAARLLETPGARSKYEDFWKQYLPVGDLRQATALPPDLVTAMDDETQTQFDKIVWDEGGSFAELLTASYTYGDPSLSQLYGTMTPDGATGRSTLTTGQRSGFVTEPAVLFSSPDSTEARKVIQRGLIVRNRLLCKVPSPPPPNLKTNPAAFETAGPDATAYEAYEAFAKENGACAACHSGFQPFGLAFEAYDDQGKFRQTYPNGKPIITSGEIKAAGDATGSYNNAVEMLGLIGNSQIGEECFAKQYGEYALGRHINAAVEACTIKALGDTAPDSAVNQLAVVLSEVEAGSNRFHTVVQ